MIIYLYKKFLWFWGFRLSTDPLPQETEMITYMLRRQKQRLGWFWWIWAVTWVGFPIWLFIHIISSNYIGG